MEGNYLIFVKNDEYDQTKQIQRQFDENDIDYPFKLNIGVTRNDSSKTLRTSKRIISYLTRDLNGDNATKINNFQELSKRINTTILDRIKKTGCMSEVTVEGEFSNPVNKYQYEQLDLKFRLTEEPILSAEYGVSIDQKQSNFGLMFKPQFTNTFGQCEQIVFRLRKSYFDFNKETKIFSSFTFPFNSPDSFIQECEFGMNNRQAIKDLRIKKYKLRGILYSVKDPRWKYTLSTTSNHFVPEINANNIIATQNSIFDQTMQTYQNLVLKASFIDKQHKQIESNTGNITQIQGQLGFGSNKSIFAKAKLLKVNQELHTLSVGDTKFNCMIQNKFQAGCIFANDKLSFAERFTLVNQPSYKSIDLNDKNINSTSFGSKFFLTNQFKYYFVNYPILQKFNIHPFLHAYSAFVPTNLNVGSTNKARDFLKQNLRFSAGVGLTFEINEFDKVDFIYSFADFLQKGNKDEFCKLQLNFN